MTFDWKALWMGAVGEECISCSPDSAADYLRDRVSAAFVERHLWDELGAINFAHAKRAEAAEAEVARLRDALKILAGKPEWDVETNGPEPYNPRWSAEQCRARVRKAFGEPL